MHVAEERRHEARRKPTTEELIDRSAKAAAKEMLWQQRRLQCRNLYRATERLLRAWPRLKRIHDHPEDYGFEPVQRSKDISVAPPPGSGVHDPMEAAEAHVDSRAASYDRTVARFNEIDAVVRTFEDKPEFVVIRMYYFGEDAAGNDRGDARPYTFEEIAEELSYAGIERSERTLRIWRTKLVQDMTVMLFGVDGAVSVEDRAPRHEEGGQ